ncbi:hypothetical protein HMPREF1624_03540 [Sporothrix schenckii ATCC 58251]|uniref:Uncharacterized protein n=1 Tax=Sporothrix schenckii (strain ATCC 58251 / de Perez 2211183) TaxID=1391915 RepID=U7Q0C2_SPOS1|nr:hypothetical protein HMPREF1624_03540 [Sporothrix schenckii ATCC 58251]
MASTTSSKRAKRLVNKLSELQYHDQELTGPICLSIKHDLRSSKYCKLAQVFSGPDTVLDIPVARGSARKFIVSQLEAQKLTNQETSVVFFSPLIRYIVSCLPPVRGKWPPTAATIFTWHCFRTHRTFCIFAFVDCTTTMPSYKYTAQQLLELRAFGVPMSLEDAPQKGVDHGIQTGSAGRQSGSESRESRTLGRFHKYRPFHTQQSSTARSRIDFPGAPDEIVYVTRQPRREATTGNPAEMEWRYRGRVGSEATSAEPVSAPTGINAQQSEGFQRFYKAVISPTHVRVTAGGRIVPNTRGTSPMSKRPKDKGDEGDLAKDANPPPDDQTQRVPDGPYLAGPHPSNLPLMSMMPLPLGLAIPGGFPFPPQPGPPGTASQMLLPEAEKNFAKENVQNGNRREPSNFKTPTFDKTREHPMHLPSEQLDRTKPFIVNGQMVYPFAPPAVPPHIAPYLVGTLPAGIDPQHARDSDYVYERELTHDETRSRYLFWGRAPSFTRKGLPKFDGKDFYPPSPANDAIGDSPPPPLLGRHVPIGAPDVDYYTGAFQPEVTQASQAGNPGRYASEFRRERQKPVKVTLRRPDSDALEDRSQVNDKNPKGFEEAPKDVTQGGKQDTQANNTRSKLLHTVLKRNISTNSEVLPGALTSATVQGVLPQYSTGYDSLVAASLSSVHSSPVALGRLSPIKSDDGSSIFVTPASRRIGENRPPPESVGPTSLEQQFQKRMTLVESNHDVSPWDSL